MGSIQSPSFKKLIFVGCTHGDEQLGRFAFDNYPCGINEYYQWRSIIANPEAMFLNTRYIDSDLNRVFPGKADGDYEERRAHQLVPILQKSDLVIDIHQSYSTTPDFMIVSEWTPELAELDHYTHFENVIILSHGTGNFKNMMPMHIPHTVAFEYGRQLDLKDAQKRLKADIESLLNKKPTGIKARKFAFWEDLSSEFKGKTHIDNFVPLTDEQRKTFGIQAKNIYPTQIDGYPPEERWAVLLQEVT